MAISFVQGDLLASGAHALVNPVNCHGVMGKGLALTFKNVFPDYFSYYRELCSDGCLRPGRVNVFVSNDKPLIVSFPTKNHWKDNSILEWIDKGLMSLADAIHSLGIKSIAIPMLGCGNGNLNWDEVRPLIVNRLSHLTDCNVLVYGPMI